MFVRIKSAGLYSLLIFLLWPFHIFSSEWQWSTIVYNEISSETNDNPRAFLWIPSGCKQVRGVVVGMHNMQEEGIMENEKFRKVMAEIGFAEIWITPGLEI